jgi:hypothetical protein
MARLTPTDRPRSIGVSGCAATLILGIGEKLAVMPVQASFSRKSTYRAYGINGEQLACEDLGSDDEAVAWVRRLVKDGLSVGRLSREIAAGFGMDIPLQ